MRWQPVKSWLFPKTLAEYQRATLINLKICIFNVCVSIAFVTAAIILQWMHHK